MEHTVRVFTHTFLLVISDISILQTYTNINVWKAEQSSM